MDRRRFVATSAAAAVGGMAGCLGFLNTDDSSQNAGNGDEDAIEVTVTGVDKLDRRGPDYPMEDRITPVLDFWEPHSAEYFPAPVEFTYDGASSASDADVTIEFRAEDLGVVEDNPEYTESVETIARAEDEISSLPGEGTIVAAPYTPNLAEEGLTVALGLLFGVPYGDGPEDAMNPRRQLHPVGRMQTDGIQSVAEARGMLSRDVPDAYENLTTAMEGGDFSTAADALDTAQSRVADMRAAIDAHGEEMKRLTGDEFDGHLEAHDADLSELQDVLAAFETRIDDENAGVPDDAYTTDEVRDIVEAEEIGLFHYYVWKHYVDQG